jgi:hypothetical protein
VAEVVTLVADYRLPRELRRMAEAAQQWRPCYEQLLSLAAETRQDGWPFQHYPEGWSGRVQQAVSQLQMALDVAVECHYPQRADSNLGHLKATLSQAACDPASLIGRQVGLVRRILADSEARWGALGSPERAAALAEQLGAAAPAAFEQARATLLTRLAALPQEGGVEDLSALLAPTESGHPLPEPLAERAKQAWIAPLSELLRSRVVTSSVVWQELCRRWGDRVLINSPSEGAGSVLREMVAQSWSSFPHSAPESATLQLWNRLAESAEKSLRLATPGSSPEVLWELARATARACQGSLYQRYYDLPVERLLAPDSTAEQLLELAHQRARQRFSDDRPQRGAIREELRLLTSDGLWPLQNALHPAIEPLPCARLCAREIIADLTRPCSRQYQRWQRDKRVAHAWQRLVFFLSLASPQEQRSFLTEAPRWGVGQEAWLELVRGLSEPPPFHRVPTGWSR